MIICPFGYLEKCKQSLKYSKSNSRVPLGSIKTLNNETTKSYEVFLRESNLLVMLKSLYKKLNKDLEEEEE